MATLYLKNKLTALFGLHTLNYRNVSNACRAENMSVHIASAVSVVTLGYVSGKDTELRHNDVDNVKYLDMPAM